MKRTGKVMLALLLLSAAGVSPAWAGKKEKKAAVSTAAPAILAGTVFSGAGFALRGAEVVVTRADLAGAKPSAKDRWKAIADARGEFFLRLPSGPAKYNVVVRATGFKPQEKELSFAADERLEQNFLLEPATGGGK